MPRPPWQASALCLDAYGQIGASCLAYLRNATDPGMTAVLAATSIHEVMDVQIDCAQQRYDVFIAEGTKSSALSMRRAAGISCYMIVFPLGAK
ncbi:MAG: hypothetical protein CFH40_00047 [Alphaproteobacteria bacterium MarineAlpha10_Bin3]|jgi:hypothetical protein|nr:MAG: hypothetical protein CFH40_00047 [Alphaproteobacteria bacterium MarineAlpha10_Bin3]PPR75670.1 MAG: hypothetical protein CFH09_00047 [Alphaproteobacteria bacterium MarineAlpha4_Bin1]